MTGVIDDGGSDLECAVIDLLTMLECKAMSVEDAIEETEIRKYL